jgi:hypothetical protein
VSEPPSTPALTCPRCGGTPDPEAGPGLLARCASCGVLGRIEGDPSQGRVVVRAALSAGEALDRLAAALAERGSGPPAIERHELVFVPYWRVETTLAGRIEGERRVVVEELRQAFDEQGARRPIVRRREDGTEAVVREIQEVQVALVSACPLEEFGLPALDRQRQMTGELGVRRRADLMGPLAVFTPALRDAATVLDPIVGRERALDEARAIVARREEGLAAGLLPGAVVEIERLGEEAALLFYPVRLSWFRVAGRPGQAAFDASTGALVSLRTAEPFAAALHRRALGLAALAAGFAVGSLLRLAALPPPILAGAGLEARIALAALALGAGAWWLLARTVRQLATETP